MSVIITRMYLDEILTYIRRTDNRAATKWCERNGVEIKKDNVSRFVIKDDFVHAYNKVTLGSTIPTQLKQERVNRYKPKSETARKLKF